MNTQRYQKTHPSNQITKLQGKVESQREEDCKKKERKRNFEKDDEERKEKHRDRKSYLKGKGKAMLN
jgi:hypothetical protein